MYSLCFVWSKPGEAVSSEPASDGGSGVLGLGVLDGSWSSASPNSDTLMLLSGRSISPSLSRGAAVLSYLLGAAWLTQPNVTIPVSWGNTCSR